jgi:hypothetical protein
MTRTVHTRHPGIRAARFTQRDLARAIKGAVAAGMKVVGTRIEPDGTLVLIYGDAGAVVSSPPVNDLDRELAEFERRHGYQA